tara:strand:+ start:349 stop:747 length:399 start_codon:yes stop_codon:yes gene_type:complete
LTKRRNFSDQIKAAVALEALRGDKTVQEIAAKKQLHPTQVSTWKRQAIEGMAGVFSDKVKKAESKDGEIKDLHAKIKVRYCSAKTLVLFLQPLQFLELFFAHSAVLLLPAAIGLFSHTDLTDRVNPEHVLPH